MVKYVFRISFQDEIRVIAGNSQDLSFENLSLKLFSLFPKLSPSFTLKYDDDGPGLVTISSDEELLQATEMLHSFNKSRGCLPLFVYNDPESGSIPKMNDVFFNSNLIDFEEEEKPFEFEDIYTEGYSNEEIEAQIRSLEDRVYYETEARRKKASSFQESADALRWEAQFLNSRAFALLNLNKNIEERVRFAVAEARHVIHKKNVRKILFERQQKAGKEEEKNVERKLNEGLKTWYGGEEERTLDPFCNNQNCEDIQNIPTQVMNNIMYYNNAKRFQTFEFELENDEEEEMESYSNEIIGNEDSDSSSEEEEEEEEEEVDNDYFGQGQEWTGEDAFYGKCSFECDPFALDSHLHYNHEDTEEDVEEEEEIEEELVYENEDEGGFEGEVQLEEVEEKSEEVFEAKEENLKEEEEEKFEESNQVPEDPFEEEMKEEEKKERSEPIEIKQKEETLKVSNESPSSSPPIPRREENSPKKPFLFNFLSSIFDSKNQRPKEIMKNLPVPFSNDFSVPVAVEIQQPIASVSIREEPVIPIAVQEEEVKEEIAEEEERKEEEIQEDLNSSNESLDSSFDHYQSGRESVNDSLEDPFSSDISRSEIFEPSQRIQTSAPVNPLYASSFQLLNEMGWKDQEKNDELLEKYQGDISEVIRELLEM